MTSLGLHPCLQGTPLIGVPAIDSVIVGDGALTISWSEPPHAAKATIASYDLRYIETSADETVDSNWTVEETVWTRWSRIDLDESAHVRLRAVGADVDITGELQDSGGTKVDTVVYETEFDRGGPLGFVLLHELSAGTHYIKVTRNTNGTGDATGTYAVLLSEDILYTDLVDACASITLSSSNTNIKDRLYGCQWHLHNEGQRKGADGEDINVEDAWTTTTGSGVNVAVVDDGMQYSHPDLTANVPPCPGLQCRNHDYTGGGDIDNPAESHGTQVAGIIAARDNNIGMRGVAPQATIYGYNYLLNQSASNERDAMTRNMSDTAVSNNSWGPPTIPAPGRGSVGQLDSAPYRRLVGRADQPAGVVEHHRVRAQVHARGARLGIRGPWHELLDRLLESSRLHGYLGRLGLRRAPHSQRLPQQGQRLGLDRDRGCRNGRYA